MTNLQVKLPDHSYEIVIQSNHLANVGEWVAHLWSKRMVALVTDTNVAPLYAEHVKNQLEIFGFKVIILVVTFGEGSKSLDTATNLYEQLAQYQFGRKDGIIALGGGVIGDLAGFVASTYMRGLSFIQIPTTLLAQVDSSIGGKTAVNLPTAKNLVGTFYQPDGVLIDVDTLQTLPKRNVREGIAEIIKTAAIADESLWKMLEQLKDEEDLLQHAQNIIAICCQIKRDIVQEDEKENGKRMILNFGHTIGHAIEQTQGYGVISHGEAVAIGMIQINKISEKKGDTPLGTTTQLSRMIDKFHLPTHLSAWNKQELYEAISHDKKNSAGSIQIVILKQIGEAEIQKVSLTKINEYL